MKLWLIQRTDRVHYDEFAGFVVRAISAERALALAQEQTYHDRTFTPESVKINELTNEGVEEVILSDFNAG